MRFTVLSGLVLSFAALVFAQKQNGENAITFPLSGTVNGGSAINIAWKPSTKGTVSLVLLKGPPADIKDLQTIGANLPNTGSFSWTPPKSLQDMSTMAKDERYAFKIIDDLTNDFEYSNPFQMTIPGSTFAATTSASLSSSSSVSTSKSTSTPTSTRSSITTTSSESTSSSPTPTTESTSTSIEVVRQSPTGTTLVTSTRSTTSGASLATASPSASAAATVGDTGLTKTALVGISVAGVVIIVLGIVCVMFCVKASKRRKANRNTVFSGSSAAFGRESKYMVMNEPMTPNTPHARYPPAPVYPPNRFR